MKPAVLEHVNVTVTDATATAKVLCDLFDWTIRWQGGSIYEGYSVHVGDHDSYLALYTPANTPGAPLDSYQTMQGLNHIGVVVPDLDATEARVRAAGFEARSHADYEPGRRSYFDGPDGIEFEAVEYGSVS